MSAPLVTVDGLTVRRQGCPVVDGAAFAAVAGERLAVVGPNGAGKSTLLKALAGVLPHAGELTLAPAVARLPRGLRFAYLPQETAFHWPMPVRDVVALGRLPHGWRGGRLSGADHAAVARAIAEAGLAGYEARAVDRLSGGEKARVALARALAVEAPVLLADEPVAALDARHQQAVMTALAGRAAAGALVVAVLHDLTLAARWANRVLLVDRGRLVADGAPAEILTPQRLEPVYGVAFDVAKLPGGPTVLPRA